MPALNEILDCLEISEFMIANMEIQKNLLLDKKYDLLFSVENVNHLVVNGMPFRDAYKKIGEEINDGQFEPMRDLNHTLEGSIGNLCNSEINEAMDMIIKQFDFEKTKIAFEKLLNWVDSDQIKVN